MWIWNWNNLDRGSGYFRFKWCFFFFYIRCILEYNGIVKGFKERLIGYESLSGGIEKKIVRDKKLGVGFILGSCCIEGKVIEEKFGWKFFDDKWIVWVVC